MDPLDAAASGSRRPSLTTRSARLSDGARSDDDYDLSALAIADGFRPTQPSHAPDLQPPALSTQPVVLAPPKTTSDSQRPSSTSKPPPSHDSLTLRNDGSSSARLRQFDAPLSSVHATNDALMRPESPYRGPLGPSHPYAMYPQRTVSSVASSTGLNSNRQSYVGPSGPTHPYALYTQTTALGDDEAQQVIPVGFTGLGNAYQRRLGPDGEEAGDLIGPLGHMEELPPYTRYPVDSHARERPREPASGTQPIPGAGGLGIATRNPEFSSTEDDLPALARSRPSSRSGASQHEINTAARDIFEKSASTKWQRRARKKLWGIVPYWAIALTLVSIVIVGVVLGAVIGTVLAKDSMTAGSRPGSEALAATADTQPLQSVPPNLAPLTEGSFSLPPLDISQAPKSCFLDTTQAQAWSCDVPFRFHSINVGRVPDAPETSNYELTLSAASAPDSKFLLGAQPPTVPDPKSLTLVGDAFEESRGPAWWLRMKYEKTVIIAEDKFPGKKMRRDEFPGPDGRDFGPPGPPPRFMRKNMAIKEGDRPWICTWPETSLEIFIYPSQNVSLPTASTSLTGTPTTATGNADATPDFGPGPVSPYPKVVKFLERRLSSNPRASARCRQVEIKSGRREKEDLKDADGNNIEATIVERPRNPSEQLAQRTRDGQVFDKRSFANGLSSREVLGPSDCGCLWLSA